MAIAEWSMGKAGGRLDDVVRSRIYVTDVALADPAARALAKRFRDARPAATLVAGARARAARAADRDRARRRRTARPRRRRASAPAAPSRSEYAYSRAVRVGDRVFISGSTALNARGTVDGPATCTARRAARSTRSSRRWPRRAARRPTSSTRSRSSPTSRRWRTTRARGWRRSATSGRRRRRWGFRRCSGPRC